MNFKEIGTHTQVMSTHQKVFLSDVSKQRNFLNEDKKKTFPLQLPIIYL